MAGRGTSCFVCEASGLAHSASWVLALVMARRHRCESSGVRSTSAASGTVSSSSMRNMPNSTAPSVPGEAEPLFSLSWRSTADATLTGIAAQSICWQRCAAAAAAIPRSTRDANLSTPTPVITSISALSGDENSPGVATAAAGAVRTAALIECPRAGTVLRRARTPRSRPPGTSSAAMSVAAAPRAPALSARAASPGQADAAWDVTAAARAPTRQESPSAAARRLTSSSASASSSAEGIATMRRQCRLDGSRYYFTTLTIVTQERAKLAKSPADSLVLAMICKVSADRHRQRQQRQPRCESCGAH